MYIYIYKKKQKHWTVFGFVIAEGVRSNLKIRTDPFSRLGVDPIDTGKKNKKNGVESPDYNPVSTFEAHAGPPDESLSRRRCDSYRRSVASFEPPVTHNWTESPRVERMENVQTVVWPGPADFSTQCFFSSCTRTRDVLPARSD